MLILTWAGLLALVTSVELIMSASVFSACSFLIPISLPMHYVWSQNELRSSLSMCNPYLCTSQMWEITGNHKGATLQIQVSGCCIHSGLGRAGRDVDSGFLQHGQSLHSNTCPIPKLRGMWADVLPQNWAVKMQTCSWSSSWWQWCSPTGETQCDTTRIGIC